MLLTTNRQEHYATVKFECYIIKFSGLLPPLLLQSKRGVRIEHVDFCAISELHCLLLTISCFDNELVLMLIDFESRTFLFHLSRLCLVLGFDDINKGAYLAFKSIFHNVLNLFWFDCEITFESVPGTN